MPRKHTTGSGVVLDLIRSGVVTRGDLQEQLGWSRVTLGRRLDELFEHELIVRQGVEATGGRPRDSLAVNKDAGVLLALDVGSSHTHVAVTDLVSGVLSEDEADIGLFDGPDAIFSWAGQVFDYLLETLSVPRAAVHGVGVGVPGPVDSRSGVLGDPQLDPRWDAVAVEPYVRGWGRPDAVVAVERDVNVLAEAESRLGWPEVHDMVVVKAGIGLGCAFVADGRVVRGSRGGAGQLSAPLKERLSEPLRRLETVASGGTARDRLAASGRRIRTGSDIVALVKRGDDEATRLIEEIGTTLGYALADVVGLLNPAALIIGGTLAELGERFIDPIRRSTFAASHAFARRGLMVERSRTGTWGGVKGASLIAQDRLFDPDRISVTTRP